MRRSTIKRTLIALCALLVALIGGEPRLRAAFCAYVIQLTTFDTQVSGATGIDYREATGSMGESLVVSVNAPSSHLEFVDPLTALHTIIPAPANMQGEIKVATVRTSACQGGFTAGDIFVGNGTPGGIARITNNGVTVQNPWVVLPGEPAFVRGLYQDRHCALGGDLVVVTGDEANPNVGNVWRVTSAGIPTLVVSLNTHLEGVITVPNDPVLWGPMAGRILAGDEDRVGTSTNGPNGKVFAVDPSGDVITIGNAPDYPQYTNYPLISLVRPTQPASINPEDLDIIPIPRPLIPGDGDFYGIANGGEDILRASGLSLTDTCTGCNQILVTQEFPDPGTTGLSVLQWDGTMFHVEPVFDFVFNPLPSSWQHVTFKGGVDCHVCTGVIGDFVWKDINGDGIQDAGEPGIAGVKVTLTKPGFTGYSQSVYTDATGHYRFTGLCAGVYEVTVTTPPGDSSTSVNVGSDQTVDSNPSPATVTLVGDNASDLTVDFGFKGPGHIGDFVWKDLNCNGIQDANEPGLAGLTVHLKVGANNGAGADAATTITDSNGQYRFDNLNPGDYTIVVDGPAGFTPSPANAGGAAVDSNPNPSNVTLTAQNPIDMTIDFGFCAPPEFGHIIVKKVTVPASDTTTAFTFTTTGAGYTGFTLTGGQSHDSGDLKPGTYGVSETTTAGWTLTSASCDSGENPASISLGAGRTVTCTFTNTRQPASLGDFVWHDTNANGIQESGEAGIGGVTVQLYDATATTVLATTTTSASGLYLFSNLAPGTYVVRFVQPSGYVFSPANQGSNDAVDSDANATTGFTGPYTLAPGETNLTVDAGFYKLASIGDFVWKDVNDNGIQDSGEAGVSGVTVQLYNGAGTTLLATTTTNASGMYLFANLTPGTYSVKFTAPAGYTFSPADQGSNDAVDSDANATTGFTGPYTLTSGQSNLTVDAGLFQPPITPPCVATTFQFSGNSPTSGTAGNVRTFTVGGVSVKASAFSRTSSGTWNTAYLGLYSQGLGVTDGSEGTGANDTHKIDNIGRDNYVLFEFNGPVTVDRAFLDLIGHDSDITVWVGNKTDPYNNHQTLSDAFLTSLGGAEQNDTSSTATSRWADINAVHEAGNVIVIAASTSDEMRDDEFKLSKLQLDCPPPPPPTCATTTVQFSGNSPTSGPAGNVRTFNVGDLSVKASAFSRTDSSGAWNTAYLGLYGPGLGVTDGSEGSGANNSHKVDNIGGRHNYVMFEFNRPVTLDKAFLDYIGADSDMTVWIGTKTDPYHNHQTLSDAFLTSLGSPEQNDTTATGTSRWADLNAARKSGNVIVIAASTSDTKLDDEFKISKLVTECPEAKGGKDDDDDRDGDRDRKDDRDRDGKGDRDGKDGKDGSDRR